MGKFLRYPSGNLSWGRIAAGVVLAILGTLVMPLLMSFMTIFLCAPVLVALLYAWSGPLPALVAAAGTVMMCALFGAPAMVAGLLALMLPALGAILLLHRRLPFFRAMALSIAIQLGLLLLTVAFAWLLVQRDLVSALADYMRAAVESLAPGSFEEQFYQVFLISMGRMGWFGTPDIDFMAATLSAAEQAQLSEQLIGIVDAGLRLNLVSIILCSGTMTGILNYALPAKVCSRRGDEPLVPYKHLHEWRLTRDMIIGLPACTLVCYIALNMGLAGTDSAYVALMNLCYLAFAFQGAGALARRMRGMGVSGGKRTALAALMMLFLQWVLSLMGVYSALFGSRGLISDYLRKRAEKKSRGDDD